MEPGQIREVGFLPWLLARLGCWFLKRAGGAHYRGEVACKCGVHFLFYVNLVSAAQRGYDAGEGSDCTDAVIVRRIGPPGVVSGTTVN
jgi:hypothetical protein